MEKFVIQPHGRLQEWIAHEKGYFRDEGLDYEFAFGPATGKPKQLNSAGKVLDPDPFSLPSDEIHRSTVESTWIEGELVYSRTT